MVELRRRCRRLLNELGHLLAVPDENGLDADVREFEKLAADLRRAYGHGRGPARDAAGEADAREVGA